MYKSFLYVKMKFMGNDFGNKKNELFVDMQKYSWA